MAIKIPQRQVMPTAQTGNTVLPVGMYDREHMARRDLQHTVGRASGVLGGISQMIMDADISKEKASFKGFVNQQHADQRAYMSGTNDYESYAPEWEKRVKSIRERSGELKHGASRRWADNHVTEYEPLWQASNDQYTRRAQIETIDSESRENINNIIATDHALETDHENSKSSGDIGPELTERQQKEVDIELIIQGNLESNIWNPQQADAVRAGAVKALDGMDAAMVAQAIENIKPNLVASMQSGESWEQERKITAQDRRNAVMVAEKTLSVMLESNLITPAEMVEHQKDLNNWVDNYAEEYKATTDKAEKETQLQIQTDLITKMPAGQTTFGDIENSGLTAGKQKEWNEYLSDSYTNPAPRENTDSGIMETAGVAMDVAMMTMNPSDAQDILLEERYIDHSITDDQMRWAIDKINNPYPKHMVPHIRATLNDNRSGHNRWFSGDTKVNTEVNESLLHWIDAEIEAGRTPSRQDMYNMSSQLRIDAREIPRLLDIGQTIERDGREHEVVGFDEKGEPQMEMIE